MIRNVIH